MAAGGGGAESREEGGSGKKKTKNPPKTPLTYLGNPILVMIQTIQRKSKLNRMGAVMANQNR